MIITKRHIDFAKVYVQTLSPADAYQKAYKHKDRNYCRIAAHGLLKKPEIKGLIDKFRIEQDQLVSEGRKKALEDLKDQILTDIELDYFHSQVLRGQLMVEEVFQVREYVPTQYDKAGGIIPGTGRWAVTFKKVQRKPNIREMQFSAAELYKRKGSYAPLKIRPVTGANDPEDEDEQPQRFILLSNGERLPFPG